MSANGDGGANGHRPRPGVLRDGRQALRRRGGRLPVPRPKRNGAVEKAIDRTRLGKGIRGAAQNREAARIVGIDVSRVYLITFALCIGITGAAGALVSPVLAVQPFQGPPLTLKAFAITALAGLGSIRGALGGALVLGLVEAGLAVYVGTVGTNLAVVASFVILVVALVVRPQGLFGGLRPVDATAA